MWQRLQLTLATKVICLSSRKGCSLEPSQLQSGNLCPSQTWTSLRTTWNWWNFSRWTSSLGKNFYLDLSKNFRGVIKSSMGISSWLAFSSFRILFFKRSLAAWSFLGSTFFFFRGGSALTDKKQTNVFIFKLRETWCIELSTGEWVVLGPDSIHSVHKEASSTLLSFW